MVLLSACQTEPEIQLTPTSITTLTLSPTYYPSSEWRTSTPDEQGLDSRQLDMMTEEIDRRNWTVDNVTIIRHGYKVLDASFGSYNPDEPHLLYSCTKSVVSSLIGIAIQQGYIESVNVMLTDLFPDREIQNMDTRKRLMNLESMLMMASGFECRDSYLYEWVGLNEMMRSDDWVQYVLDLPMEYAPGIHFEYCNGVSNLLSAAVQENSGMHTAAFAEEYLFGPLGIDAYQWEEDSAGIPLGFSELYLRPSDMARFGYLYLHGGAWDGEQIVSSEWVTASTTEQIAADTLQDGYGYQWWTDDAGYYAAVGYRGQFIFVLPDYDMVVVFVSDPDEGDFDLPEYLLLNYIIPAVQTE
jgi:CubicO group peptidase (beta-lactamase class C family)